MARRSQAPNSAPRLSVLIPALNEEAAIVEVLRELPLQRLHQVIVVDNGSTDRTAEVAAAFGAPVRVVSEPRRGYGSACLAGLAAMKPTDIVVFLDGDHSFFARDVLRVARPIAEGRADFVCGSRMRWRSAREAMHGQGQFGNWLAAWGLFLIGAGRWTDLGPLRAIGWDCLRRLRMADRNYGWTVEMQVKAVRRGLRCLEIPVGYRDRIGVSKITGTFKGSLLATSKITYLIARYAFVR